MLLLELSVQAGNSSLMQNAAVSTQSVTVGEHIDGVAIRSKGPGIGDIYSPTHSSLLDNVKAESREQKPDADMFQRNAEQMKQKFLSSIVIDHHIYLLISYEVSFRYCDFSASSPLQFDSGNNEIEDPEARLLDPILYQQVPELIHIFLIIAVKALALGLANVIGGLVILGHNIRELKNDRPRGVFTEMDNEEDRYRAVLGQRQNFVLHVIVAVVSFLFFGLVPPVVYGFSFRKSDDKT
ncbi:hypothetical protein F3Y22_tig00110429pilonHSYRG00415 [Hibiscus syriacus]|uniref:Uncharacterized protein n=1 Tax=Hibiscus syriacus TaxID=106335 RepID=A0A6A3AL04_HIBSY|nr:hypothetical protein F3Y22_tig00110429pilonHSYRG00415 [Hibiscus syriacus]